MQVPNDVNALGVIREEGEEAGGGGAIAGAKAMIHGLPHLSGVRKLVKGIGARKEAPEPMPAKAAIGASAESQKFDSSTAGLQFFDHAPQGQVTASLEHSTEMTRKSSNKSREMDKKESATTRSSGVSRSGAKESSEKSSKPDRKDSSRKDDKSSKSDRKELADSKSRVEQNGGSADPGHRAGGTGSKHDLPEPRNGIDRRDTQSTSTVVPDTVGSMELKNLATAEQTSGLTTSKSDDKPQRSTHV